MPSFGHGLERAIGEIVTGFAIGIAIREMLIALGRLDILLLFYLLSAGAIVLLVDIMKYWSFSYLIGWLVGFIIFAKFFGLVGDFAVHCCNYSGYGKEGAFKTSVLLSGWLFLAPMPT